LGIYLISKGLSPESVFGKENLWEGEMPEDIKIAALICLRKSDGYEFNYKTMSFYRNENL
jgi:hypothetical protein